MTASVQTINDVLPKTQIVATSLQTVFDTDWTADDETDILVYARADGVEPDDATQIVSRADYNVTFVGSSLTVRVTFSTGRTLDDIVTIIRDTPADRTNLYTNTNFTPTMLNQDFGLHTLVDQQAQMYNEILTPHYNTSCTLTDPDTPAIDVILPVLGANQIWAKNNANDEIIAYDVPSGGGLAPDDATYLLQTANAELPNSQAMGALATGLVVNTTTTGVQLTRTLDGTANEIDVSNGTGLSGNPTVGITDNPTVPGTSHMFVPMGTTAQRPASPTDGMVRYNTTEHALEVYENTVWDPLSGGVVDTVVGTANEIDVDSTDPQNPILTLSATIDAPGTFTIQGTVALDSIIDDDTMATATATNIPTAESIKAYVDSFGPGTVTSVVGTTNEIVIDNTTPSDPIVGIADNAVLPGTGGVTVPKGTVAQRSGAAGTMRFNTDASVFEVTLDGAAWQQLDTHTAGDVDSIIGTANQISASSPTGNVTLSLPAVVDMPGTFNIQSTTAMNAILDEDNMASDSATALATQQSIKAYVDMSIGASNLNDLSGRLTLTTGEPITTTDITNAGTIYFTPFKGNSVSLYNGATWDSYDFTEISLAVPAVATQVYDVFLYDNAGTLTLEAVAWTSDTARATALALQDGVYVKTGALGNRYLGTFRTIAASQVSDSNRFRHLWNYYNRVKKTMVATDGTDSWTYTTATWRQARASTSNQLDLVIGVSEDPVESTVLGIWANTNISTNAHVSIGLDSTTVPTANIKGFQTEAIANGTNTTEAYWFGYTGIGRHTLVWLEYSSAVGTNTFFGDAGVPTLAQSGIFGFQYF
jgi:hypothetical protein